MWVGLALKALGTYGQWRAERQQAIAVGKQMAEQATNAIRSMNYAFQNYEQERKDAFDGAVANLEKMLINTRGLQGSVDNAVSEEMGDSNTGRLLSRSVHAESLRASLSEKMNYERKSNEVDLNKEQQLVYTKSYTSGLHPPKVPSTMNLLHRLFIGSVDYFQQQKQVEQFRKLHNYEDQGTDQQWGNRNGYVNTFGNGINWSNSKLPDNTLWGMRSFGDARNSIGYGVTNYVPNRWKNGLFIK